MLGNLKNPPEPFEDIIRTHFRLKARSIVAQLDDWVTLDDGKPTAGDGEYFTDTRTEGASSGSGFHKDVQELKKMLLKSRDDGA